MNTIATPSTAGLSKYPRLASWVEKPPIATVEKLCATASNHSMPAAR